MLHRTTVNRARASAALFCAAVAMMLAVGPVFAAGFSTPTLVFAHKYAPDHAMVVDASGYVHIAVEGGDVKGMYYGTNAPSGTWSWTRLTSKWDFAPSIAMDSSGRIVIAFNRTDGNGISYGIWTATKTSSGWTINARYTKSAWEPSVALYNGHVALAFEGPKGQLLYRTNLSGSWTTTTVANSGCCANGGASLAIVNGVPEIAWSKGSTYSNGPLRFSYFSSGWHSVTVDSRATSQPTLIDHSGPYMVYVRTGGAGTTALAAPAQSGWFFNTYGSGYAEHPDLAIANNNVYIVESNSLGYPQSGTKIRLATAPLSNPSIPTYTTVASNDDVSTPEVGIAGSNVRVIFDRHTLTASSTDGIYYTSN